MGARLLYRGLLSVALLSVGLLAASPLPAGAADPAAPVAVSFPTTDGGEIHADSYGDGKRGLVLAHGGQFTKESWRAQAPRLAAAGFRVLAIDFRGRGESRGPGVEPPTRPGRLAPLDVRPHYLDVLGAVRYLRAQGVESVAVLGASIGGAAAAQAAIEAQPGEIDRLVLLAHAGIDEPERLTVRKLFITSEGDRRIAGIREQYERAPEPKTWVALPGTAHAQHVFPTDQGPHLLEEILAFLTAP